MLDKQGQGRGYVSVELRPRDGSDSVIAVADENGSFMFDEVPPGTYELHVRREDCSEIESDTPQVHLSSGYTMTVNVILK